MKFVEWREAFLSKNNRHQLRGELFDGVPLYRYKLSAIEFSELKDCLRTNLKSYLSVYDIEDISNRSAEFPPLFVLYAANWWQREYDGTGMNWEPIFSSIGVDYDTLPSNTRSQMIKRGFTYWNLQLNTDIGNLKFIGNIASQGGLPLKLIASDKNGNLNRLLKRTLKEVVNLAFPDKQNIVAMIESHQQELPKSYRQSLIYDLLAEIISTFIHLKNEANLASASNPIEKLNQFNPNWRDSFPLPMDDENAKGVLERFVQEGARIKAERQKFALKFSRAIRFLEDGFEINATVHLPDQAEDTETIQHVFGVDADFLSRQMSLKICNEIETREIAIRRLAGQSKYRFDALNKVEFSHAISTASATLKSDAGIINLDLQNAEELDDESPWVFDADENNQYQFIKAGAGKFKSAKVYVVINESFKPKQPLVCLGSMRQNPIMKCYLVESETTFCNVNEEQTHIQPNAHDAANDSFMLRGERVWDIFQKPSMAFKGTPQLSKAIFVTQSHQTFSPVNALCRNIDNKPLSSVAAYGPLHLVVKEDGNQVWTSKVAVLPTTANFKVIPGSDAQHGTIELVDWGLLNLKCLTPEVEINAKKGNNKLAIDCEYLGQESPSEYITFECFWPGNPKSATLNLPFPSAGVLAFNSLGDRLSTNKPLSLREIYGVRIISFLMQGNFVELELNLKDTGGVKIEPFQIKLKRDRKKQKLELRLLDFKDLICDLLYSVDSLDARVELRLKVPGSKDFKCEIKKYDLLMSHSNGSAKFSIQQNELQLYNQAEISECNVLACRLDDVDEVITLQQAMSEGVQTGSWMFPTNEYTEGCWMVYPDVSSSIQFRPMMLPLGESEDAKLLDDETSLFAAQKIANKIDRVNAIHHALNVMIEDFNHPDWGHVEHLASHLGHLNLTSLDVWCTFAKNKRAMASLALREGKLPEQFISKFSNELPFMWEFVSLEDWLDASFYLHEQLLQKWPDNEQFAEEYYKFCLNKKLDDLLIDQPSLRVLFEIVRHKNKLPVSRDFQFLLAQPAIFETMQSGALFYNTDSTLQMLFQTDLPSWPSYFYSEIRKEKHGEHAALFCRNSYDYKEPVINLPIILAVSSLSGQYPEWLKQESHYLRIKQMRNFDRDWFATAFDITVARASINGYVQL